MSLSSETVMYLLLAAAVFAGLVTLGVIRDRRTLTFHVTLDSRKKFTNFDPNGYLLTLPEEKLDELALLLEPDSKKRRFRLRWSYSTPSGKSTSTQLKKYSIEEVQDYVAKLQPIYSKGKNRVEGLNRLYAEQLRLGKEMNDGKPKIYCYSIPGLASHQGLVKVGYAKTDAHKRIEQQFKTAARLKVDYKIHLVMTATTISGETFMDHKVHRILKNAGVANAEGEWFRCSVLVAEQAIRAAQRNLESIA